MAPMSMRIVGRKSSTMASCMPEISIPLSWFDSGYSSARRAMINETSAAASSTVTPSASRPTTSQLCHWRACAMSPPRTMGANTSASTTNRKSGGVTPTTVNGDPFTVSVEPIIEGSAPSRVLQ